MVTKLIRGKVLIRLSLAENPLSFNFFFFLEAILAWHCHPPLNHFVPHSGNFWWLSIISGCSLSTWTRSCRSFTVWTGSRSWGWTPCCSSGRTPPGSPSRSPPGRYSAPARTRCCPCNSLFKVCFCSTVSIRGSLLRVKLIDKSWNRHSGQSFSCTWELKWQDSWHLSRNWRAYYQDEISILVVTSPTRQFTVSPIKLFPKTHFHSDIFHLCCFPLRSRV